MLDDTEKQEIKDLIKAELAPRRGRSGTRTAESSGDPMTPIPVKVRDSAGERDAEITGHGPHEGEAGGKYMLCTLEGRRFRLYQSTATRLQTGVVVRLRIGDETREVWHAS